jgi:hypothetical protein
MEATEIGLADSGGLKSHTWARCQLMPVILPTQKAEIRRIIVQRQLGEIVLQIVSRKNPSQKNGWWSGLRCRH